MATKYTQHIMVLSAVVGGGGILYSSCSQQCVCSSIAAQQQIANMRALVPASVVSVVMVMVMVMMMMMMLDFFLVGCVLYQKKVCSVMPGKSDGGSGDGLICAVQQCCPSQQCSGG